MKLLGAIMIIGAFMLCSLSSFKSGVCRIHSLEAACTVLEHMKGELCTSLLPLPQLFKRLSERLNGEAKEFSDELSRSLVNLGEENFSALWEKSAKKELPYLNEEEMKSFSSLGLILGRFQLEIQLEAIEKTEKLLGEHLNSAKESLPAEGKLRFGVSTGAAFLIVLWLL